MKTLRESMKMLRESMKKKPYKYGGGPWAARSISDYPYLNNLQRQHTLDSSLANLHVMELSGSVYNNTRLTIIGKLFLLSACYSMYSNYMFSALS